MVGLLLAFVFGGVWFIAIPVVFLLFLIPVAFTAALAARRTRRTSPSSVAPTSQEASYNPVVDPSERSAGR